ncbi:MAG: class I SAM-dependent methyltransferase [Candidatus Omnitrophica bacterium]|nr:class I SAM-dependent methyltransferase [Candidatus Omnitrophota bacterium]
MKIRLYIGLLLLKITETFNLMGRIFKNILLVVLLPQDLSSLNKLAYNNKGNLNALSSLATRGLNEGEKELISKYCLKPGKFLVLGCGAGRETYALAKMGFVVTGIDFVETLLGKARAVAEEEQLRIEYINKDILLWAEEERKEKYDYILVSNNVYLQIPSKKIRINFLNRALNKLSDDGLFIVINNCISDLKYSKIQFKLKRLLARIMFANVGIEAGDWIPIRQFFHRPQNKNEFLTEFQDSEALIYEVREDKNLISVLLKHSNG